MVFPSTWTFSKKWTWKSQAEINVSESAHPPSMDVDEHLADLTTKIAKESIYVTAQGGLGDVWKCRYIEGNEKIEVAVKCVRIEIPDEQVKDFVNKRLMDDFFQWKQLKHDHILPVYGITHGFGPVPAMVSPWMHNGSLSAYLDKHHNEITVTQKFTLLADVAAGLQYLHSKELAHTDLTGNNVLVDHGGRARIADYGLLATCTDLNGTSYIRSNVRWAAPELFEVPDADDACSSPKLESDIYSFGCIAYQVLSGQRPYCEIRSDHQVVVAILRGVKPRRPVIPAIEDHHWDFIKQCWVDMSQRPSIADIQDLMDR